LFTFLNGAMTHATQRFLNFALGQNDVEQVRDVYSASLVIHALIALLVIILAQTIGLWFFRTWLNLPSERYNAALVVYQFSVAVAVIGILQVPYRATIIAYEKMSFFAMVSVIEAVLRLGTVFLLPVIMFDKLIAYALFLCITGIVIFLIHKVYCNKTFEIAHFRYCRDKTLFRQLFGFSGWSAFGGVAGVSRDHGINILVNIFHGVTVNAAMGIATQVNLAIFQFVGNFQTAFSPQIIKSYSAKNYDCFTRLIFRTAKFSFCLLFLFVLPIYINANFVLQIWLNNVPEYTVPFTRLMLIYSLLIATVGSLRVAIQATGDIKKYQIVISCFVFANLPLSFLVLWIGLNPLWVLIIKIGLETLLIVWRIYFLGEKIQLPVRGFFCEVIIPIFFIAGISTFATVFVQNLFVNNWNRLIISCIISVISICCLMYWLGLSSQEKKILHKWVKIKIGKDNSCSS